LQVFPHYILNLGALILQQHHKIQRNVSSNNSEREREREYTYILSKGRFAGSSSAATQLDVEKRRY